MFATCECEAQRREGVCVCVFVCMCACCLFVFDFLSTVVRSLSGSRATLVSYASAAAANTPEHLKTSKVLFRNWFRPTPCGSEIYITHTHMHTHDTAEVCFPRSFYFGNFYGKPPLPLASIFGLSLPGSLGLEDS